MEGPPTPDGGSLPGRLSLAAEQAAAETRLPIELLGDAVQVLAAANAGQTLDEERLQDYRSLGARASRSGYALPDLLGLYLAASWRLWPLLDGGRNAESVFPAETALRVMQQLLTAVSAGHDAAQRQAALEGEARHREFVHDLLTGSGDAEQLAASAARAGLRLSAAHRVVVLATDRALLDFGPVAAEVEAGLRARLGGVDCLVASRDGLLAVLLPESATELVDFLASRAQAVEPARRWRICVSRTHPGLPGIRRGWQEARETLAIARRLDWPQPITTAADVAVYALLLRDRDALAALTEEVLGPLRRARGGPEPLLATLQALFQAVGNATAAARAQHLSVRAFLYRLDRIEQLTGLRLSDPRARLQLELALLGAALLDWPAVST